MELCFFGCGREAMYQQKNGRLVCSRPTQRCPTIVKKAGERSGAARRGSKQSEDHKAKKVAKLIGRPVSPETGEKISIAKKAFYAKNGPPIPWNKGLKGSQIAWNKGIRREEPMVALDVDDPVYLDSKKYRNRVSVRTRVNYQLYKDEINPHDLPLGRCGVPGAYQIDHIVSVREGFEKGIPVEVIAAKENLRIVPWRDNVIKYGGTSSRRWMKYLRSDQRIS